MKYCSRCVYPEVAVNLVIQGNLCTACLSFEEGEDESQIDWAVRAEEFAELAALAKQNSRGNYDCVVPVSGGKDSYYQTHVAIEYGLKPLLVTYHGNNYLPEGDWNRDRMRSVFDADHLVMGPSVDVLKKMNRLGFRKMGDMNWHAHAGIYTYPMHIAVKLGIPLVIWGEIPWDISGMYSPHDKVEFNNRLRREHDLRGFEWTDFVGDPEDFLEDRDLNWAKYPTDDEVQALGLRGIFIGNYFKWDANLHVEIAKREYGWKASEVAFDRTYRRMSNLDDRYENGVHDLLKFLKFGYGRASDHASKDIRAGHLSRSQGIDMVRQYDHIVSSDLRHWLEYVELSEAEFWRIADSFRDPRVWRIEGGTWVKDNIWGESSSYGEVHLDPQLWSKFQVSEKGS